MSQSYLVVGGHADLLLVPPRPGHDDVAAVEVPGLVGAAAVGQDPVSGGEGKIQDFGT